MIMLVLELRMILRQTLRENDVCVCVCVCVREREREREGEREGGYS